MKTNAFLGRDWIDAELDFSKAEYETFIDVALELKRRFALGEDTSHFLRGKTLFTMFYNQSLRTRTTFHAGINQLGGFCQNLEPGKIYTPARKGFEKAYSTERIADVARVLERIGDALAIRMYGDPAQWVYGRANEILKEFAEWSNIPIINMECDKYHPCQGLADVITVKERFGGFKGIKFVMSWAYSGSCHKPLSVPQSAVLAATKVGMDVVQVQPEGLELHPQVVESCHRLAAEAGGSFQVMHDMEAAFEGAHVVYPKSWGSLSYFADPATGEAVDMEGMKGLFEANKDWICTSEKMALARPDAIYMHCLPADRGQEVTDEVIDGPQSVVFDEAENRLHAQKAIMALCMGGRF